MTNVEKTNNLWNKQKIMKVFDKIRLKNNILVNLTI